METRIDPRDALRGVLPDDPAVLDAAGADDALTRLRGLRGFLDSYEAKVTLRIAELHAAGAAMPAADAHARCGGVSAKEARRKERRAAALNDAPSLADKLATGEATAAHADVLANAAGALDDETRAALFGYESELAADAARMTPEQFGRSTRDLIRLLERDQGLDRDRRQRRDTRLTKTVDRDGMYSINAKLHPELGHAVFHMLNTETARLVKEGGDRSADRAHLDALALGNLVTGGHQAVRPHEAEVHVLIDAATLLDEPHETSVCELGDGTALPAPSVRRLVCNGRIVPIIIDTNGVVLNAGRAQRLANRHQRRALRAMYPTCAFPGCDVEFSRCEIHHLVEWEFGGVTDLDQLLPLCSHHHHTTHDLGLILRLDAGRTLTIHTADGRPYAVAPLRPPGRESPAEPAADPRRRWADLLARFADPIAEHDRPAASPTACVSVEAADVGHPMSLADAQIAGISA